MRTADVPAKLELAADRARIRSDGKDLAFVTLRIADRNGLTAPRADNRIRFTLEGPADIVATDNGDPTSFEPFQSSERSAFNGLCLAIVRGRPGQPGKVTLRAESASLEPATVVLQTVREIK
jgi:beta-galactosidase